MRYAILSDIHSNLEALEIVLEDLDRRGCDQTVCLGDFVGYGPNPNECVRALVERLEGRAVAGNHDWAAVDKLEITFFNPFAREAILWTREALEPPVRDYLQALPTEWTHSNSQGFLAVHGSPRDPIEEYVLDGGVARENFAFRPFGLCFIGHSHVPGLFAAAEDRVEARDLPVGAPLRLNPSSRYLINVGSVGQPRDGDPRAAYLVFDAAAGAVTLLRLEYPVARTQEKMREAGLPAVLADRLNYGR